MNQDETVITNQCPDISPDALIAPNIDRAANRIAAILIEEFKDANTGFCKRGHLVYAATQIALLKTIGPSQW